MNLKKKIIAILIFTTLLACNRSNQQIEKMPLDSIRDADSTAAAIEQQRLIDSVNMVTIEQQIIADSITNQVTN